MSNSYTKDVTRIVGIYTIVLWLAAIAVAIFGNIGVAIFLAIMWLGCVISNNFVKLTIAIAALKGLDITRER